MSKRDPLSHAVSVALSVNRTIFLRLHGADGEVIAHAPLRAIDAARVASELLCRIGDARKDIVIEGKPIEKTDDDLAKTMKEQTMNMVPE